VPMPSVDTPELKVAPFELEFSRSKFDLALFMSEGPQGITAAWQYATDLFTPETIRRISGNFMTLLRSIVSQPQARIRSLEMLTEAECAEQQLDKQQHQQSKLSLLKTARRKVIATN
jgi:non-ribosomal peptide synthetase component F